MDIHLHLLHFQCEHLGRSIWRLQTTLSSTNQTLDYGVYQSLQTASESQMKDRPKESLRWRCVCPWEWGAEIVLQANQSGAEPWSYRAGSACARIEPCIEAVVCCTHSLYTRGNMRQYEIMIAAQVGVFHHNHKPQLIFRESPEPS